MRLTIERIRTMVLLAGVLLVVALGAFLAIGKWKNPFNRRDLPQRLGLNIQQEANGWTFAHALGAHSQYKIHASKLVQMKQGNHVVLHDVKIELYGEDGSRVDRIEGSEFEYDPKARTAKAAGQVEITLMRPAAAPAIAPKATPGKVVSDKPKDSAVAIAAQTASAGEMHVKTSGLTFDENSGVAETSQRVEFSLAQGNGSAIGASYDSEKGLLVLNHAVELNTRRGADVVELRAGHAEFERADQVCRLRAATAKFHGGEATAGEAKILFRADGTAVRLEAQSGFAVATATGGHLAAPIGLLEFDEHNQPRHGHLQGGVTMDSLGEGRHLHGTSPAMELEFTNRGELRHVHLERDVEIASEEETGTGIEAVLERRTWRSPVADINLLNAGKGKFELDSIEGKQGVVVTGESQRGNGPMTPSRLAADELTGQFGPDSRTTKKDRPAAGGSVLTTMIGTGHATMEETSASGARQTTNGDRLEAHFASGSASGPSVAAKRGVGIGSGRASPIESAIIDGHVVLTEETAARAGGQATPMRATSGRAVYEGAGAWLHLTLAPHVEDGGLQLTADKVDISQASGDAFAHGNVKASWLQGAPKRADKSTSDKKGSAVPGGQGPAHAIAAEAQLHQMTGEATFRGQARLWQEANSVAAPVIVLDRMKQTLVARSTSQAEPVRVVMVSAAGMKAPDKETGKDAARTQTPVVIRLRGGDLKYSDAERKAVMHAGPVGNVVAETGTATVKSSEVELILLPPGNHAGRDGEQAQVDSLAARGDVMVTSQGRRGTGEQLVYSGETGEYVLTGTAAAPPRMTDPARGTVTGEALIFRSRDDSVSIEGGGRKTTTETTAPK